jgi:Putative lumazine-binding
MSAVGERATVPAEVEAAIVDVVLDYFEGWYDGDVERMTRALHEDLAKRSLAGDGRGVETISAREMIDATAKGRGKRDDPAERRLSVRVDDVYATIANVTVMSVPYAEYVQLVRTNDGWKIVNALWQRR